MLDDRRRTILEMPFKTLAGDERTLLRMPNGIWIGINLSTIESIPFLKTFCSERWSSVGEIRELTSVNPMTLKLVDFVKSSGRDLHDTPITRFHLKDKIAVSTLFRDLDFLNIPYLTASPVKPDIISTCRMIRRGSTKAVDILVHAFQTDLVTYHRLEDQQKAAVFEAVHHMFSHPRNFCQNQQDAMRSTIEDKLYFTFKQKNCIFKQ